MLDQEKFAGLKQDALRHNEARYGAEIRAAYGAQAVDAANANFQGLCRADYEAMQALEREIRRRLEAAVAAGRPPEGAQGREIAEMHRKWLAYTWSACTPEAHRGVADLYTADGRFTAYYDAAVSGCAAWLRDAIYAWAS
ncbi:MAG: TipAS antibiotic-recognition domain-containing protein [Clostridiales bacterium]|nr:TipAS antibiotic-recognition domain-containing protein [Clostridiales bacterium]